MKMSATPTRKKVSWFDKVNITVDAETAYYPATQHAEIFAIMGDAEPVPVNLIVPVVPDDEPVPAAPAVEPEIPAGAEELDSHLPMQTSPVALTKTTHRVQSGQTLTPLATQQQPADDQEAPDNAPREQCTRHRKKLFYNSYRHK